MPSYSVQHVSKMKLYGKYRRQTVCKTIQTEYKLNVFIQNDLLNSIEKGTLKHDEHNTVTGSLRTYMYTVYKKISR